MKPLNKTRLICLFLLALFSLEIVVPLWIVISVRNPSFFPNISKTFFSRQPERLTELYFTNHLDLPKEIEPGKSYTFEFTVHNLEYQDFTYFYQTTADALVLTQGQFRLKHDENKTIPVAFQISPPLQRTQITVNLVNKNQPIHFWVEEKGD